MGKARSPLVLAAQGHPEDPVMGTQPKINSGHGYRDWQLTRCGSLWVPTAKPGGPGGPGSPMLPWGPGKPCSGKSGVRGEMPRWDISPGRQLSPGKGFGVRDRVGGSGGSPGCWHQAPRGRPVETAPASVPPPQQPCHHVPMSPEPPRGWLQQGTSPTFFPTAPGACRAPRIPLRGQIW